MKHYSTFLALGDSYTIGEGVALHDSFPYQTVQQLRQHGQHIHAPEIVARTGWTTFELAAHILHNSLNEKYDIVTLLIGVNNQYRGLPVEDYKDDFTFLLKKAIHLSGEQSKNVFVLSIPAWGCTPFAAGRNSKQISTEIAEYNFINKSIAITNGANYIDITTGTKEAATESSLLTSDQLHPSAKEYARWATALTERIIPLLNGR